MSYLKNPFAIRNGRTILIEDLSVHERGLDCNCICPNCNGDFIARMGDKKIHHFAHSKDACDEVLAYTTGLYKLIYQMLSSGNPFYVPALTVYYHIPYSGEVTETNIEQYCSLFPESRHSEKKIIVAPGRMVIFSSAEIVYDNKDHVEAIELTCSGSSMAIKVMPPNTVCKVGSVKRHKDMTTLVLDFTYDADMIQSSNSNDFSKHISSENVMKYWIYNTKQTEAYQQILAESIPVRERYLEEIRIHKERRRLEEQRLLKETKKREARDRQITGALKAKELARTIPKTPPAPRLIKCNKCGELKPTSEFFAGQAVYVCQQCMRRKQ